MSLPRTLSAVVLWPHWCPLRASVLTCEKGCWIPLRALDPPTLGTASPSPRGGSVVPSMPTSTQQAAGTKRPGRLRPSPKIPGNWHKSPKQQPQPHSLLERPRLPLSEACFRTCPMGLAGSDPQGSFGAWMESPEAQPPREASLGVCCHHVAGSGTAGAVEVHPPGSLLWDRKASAVDVTGAPRTGTGH